MGDRKPLRVIGILWILAASLALILVGQNCSRTSFTSSSTQPPEIQQLNAGGGNGEGYEGKLTFIHAKANFLCEGQYAPKSILRWSPEDQWTLTENTREKCASIDRSPVTNINHRFGEQIIRFRGAVYLLDPSAPWNPSSLAGHYKHISVDPSTDPDSSDVNPGDDLCENFEGKCSLRASLEEVTGLQTKTSMIYLPSGTYRITRQLDVESNSHVALIGEDRGSTIIDGGGFTSLFSAGLAPGAGSGVGFGTLRMENLTLRNGFSGISAYFGGAFTIYDSLYLRNATLESQNGSQAIYARPGFQQILFEETLLEGGTGHGISLFNPGSFTLLNSTIRGFSGIGFNVTNGSSDIQIIGSSLLNNRSGTQMRKCRARCQIHNSTIANNDTYGILLTYSASDPYTEALLVRHSTIYQNAQTSDSNIIIDVPTPASPNGNVSLRLQNSIVGGVAARGRTNCQFTEQNQGFTLVAENSIIEDNSCQAPGALIGDPLLDILGNYGGPTPTFRPLSGSPALDSADPQFCPLVDQRGLPRPGPQSSAPEACDMGSVEVQ